MKITKLLMLLTALALASCGGGESASVTPTPPPPPPPSGGFDRGGVSIGVITGFGSIYVNGVRFDASSATFNIDDAPGMESDLAVGKVVTVVGTIGDDNQNGTASQVIFDDEAEGPISSINLAAGTLVVMGQTVLVDSATHFDDSIVPNALDGLSVGQVVEISGFVGADGSITASHIELTDDTEFEVTGTVTALDAVATTFQINALTVDYSTAMLEDFPAGQLENDMRVEAEGSSFGANGELIATKVEFKDGEFPGDDDDDIEIEGLITRFVSATDFDVAGRPVTTTGITEFENGPAMNLAEGVKVEVEGHFDGSGTLVAEKVSFRINSTIEVEAIVDAVDTTAGTVTLLGLVFSTTAVTRYEDDSNLDVPMFGLDDISVGDWLETKAYVDASDNLIATQIQRDDSDDEVKVEAPVEAVARPNVQMLGLTIQTDSNTDFEDANDLPITADEFFAQVSTTSIVQAKGSVMSGNVILASEIELEDED